MIATGQKKVNLPPSHPLYYSAAFCCLSRHFLSRLCEEFTALFQALPKYVDLSKQSEPFRLLFSKNTNRVQDIAQIACKQRNKQKESHGNSERHLSGFRQSGVPMQLERFCCGHEFCISLPMFRRDTFMQYLCPRICSLLRHRLYPLAVLAPCIHCFPLLRFFVHDSVR